MGEYADLILSGSMCELCGMYLPDEEGSPRRCKSCGEDANQKYTYVTFGTDHTHKLRGKYIDSRCIAIIKCDDKEHGRKIAFELFSTQFCFEYHEEEFQTKRKYFPRGFIYVN